MYSVTILSLNIGDFGNSDIPVRIGNFDYEPTRRMIQAARKNWPTTSRRRTFQYYFDDNNDETSRHETR